MRHVFCIVGLACMGKTHARRSVFQEALGLGAFSSDHAARLVMEASRTPIFSVEDREAWLGLAARVDLGRLKTWAYLDQLSSLGLGPLGADGFGFFEASERSALSTALERSAEPSRVHYLHLVRPLGVYNQLRATRRWPAIDDRTLSATLARFDLAFLNATVADERALLAYAHDWVKADG